CMRSLFLPGLLIIAIVTSNLALGQNLPSNTSRTVEVLPSYYSCNADDGTTVVLGEVQNNNNFPITDVKVGISFLNDNDNTIEYKTGTTLLHVVPAGGKAPFSISSSKSDPSITQVSAKMAGFISSSAREHALDVSPGLLQVSDKLIFSGTIKNNGVIKSPNTPTGAPVKISSEMKYIVNKAQQSFVYYVQVKQFDGQVTFIGKHEGIFLGAGDQSISVTWTPDTSGSYYIETYVWNSDNIPLSSAGTRINFVLVKS